MRGVLDTNEACGIVFTCYTQLSSQAHMKKILITPVAHQAI